VRRRDFVKRLSAGLALGPLVLKLQGCVGDTEVPTAPGSGGGGGTGNGGGGADAGSDLLQFRVTNMDSSGHSHWFFVECTQVEAGADTTYTAEGSHTHLVPVTGTDLDQILAGNSITIYTNDSHPHTWIIQMPSGMCSGDGASTPPPDGGDGSGGGGGGGGGW
jgi:hypothetical protein